MNTEPCSSLESSGRFDLSMVVEGLLTMMINPTYKAFLGVSWLYMITTAFTLAKMLRDKHEAVLLQTARNHRVARSDMRTAEHSATAAE